MKNVYTDFLKFKKYDIFYRIFNDDINTKKGVLFLHGKSTHSKYLEHITDFEGADAITFFALDYPGKGMSSGKRGNFNSFKYLLEIVSHFINKVVKKKNIESIHIIGESYGAAAAFYICNNITANIGIDSLIFLPGIYRIKTFEKVSTKIYLFLFGKLFPHFQHPVSKIHISRFSNLKEYQDKLLKDKYFDRKASVIYLLGLYKFIRYMYSHISNHNIPFLIFHGGNDNYTSYDMLMDFYNQIPVKEKKIVLLKSSQHWLLGSEDLDVIKKELGSWVRR